MKKERYFRHELERMFIAYAIVPAVIFTMVCGMLFMTVLLHGKRSGNIEHNRYVAGLLDNVLARYEGGVEEMASQPGCFDNIRDPDGKAELFGIFYGITNSLGLEGDLFVMDSSRNILMSSRSDLPHFLDVPEDVSWGIFDDMDREPHKTALRLAEGWKSGDSTIAIGRSVMEGNRKLGYILCSIPSSQFKALVDKPDIQTIIADPFGWAYVSSNCSGLVITALVLMTLWMLLNSRKVTEKKTEDFYKILDVMENARDGDLEGVIRIQSDNEFKIIADAYNETIQSLRIQMENNKKMAELVSVAQNKQLESQFNPHFLYNTLENIRYMCKLEPATAERMVFSLSNLLRYSLDGSKAEVTLKEDLEHLESYLTILKRRFGERFRCRIDVEPEAMDLRIPKLVLQPMIENAVKYGFGKQLNLTVELKAYIHEGKLIMICRDDGVGIPQGTLSELTALLEQKENPRRHSGLYNIHRRIDILYGRPYGVEIRSAEGHGTTLVVTLPVKREESDGCCVC